MFLNRAGMFIVTVTTAGYIQRRQIPGKPVTPSQFKLYPMKPNIDISLPHAAKVAALLNRILADEHVLYIRTRNYHWNVTGPRFHDLHKFLEGQYNELALLIDEVAERVRKVGGISAGTMEEFLKLSALKEKPGEKPTYEVMLGDLLHDHETIICFIRENLDLVTNEYKDAGSADFLTGALEQHETMAWMLRSYLS